MKLELTLPAMERLIGGDSEIEIGLRRKLVEEFAKQHLKTLVNDSAFKAISATWLAEISAAVAITMKALRDEKQSKIDSGRIGQDAAKWTWNLREAIEKAALTAVETAIQESSDRWTVDISRSVLREVRKQIEQHVDAELEARVKDRASTLSALIDNEVEVRIRERLEAVKSFGRPVVKTTTL